MSVVSKKTFTLNSKYDDSDPDAKTLESDILRALNIKQATLYAHLPAKKYPREDGYILGIKLAEDDESIPPPPPLDEPPPIEQMIVSEILSETELIKASEPIESLQQLKELARHTNTKIAEMYKSLHPKNIKAVSKKEPFPEWFKSRIWSKDNGSLEKAKCPVCSDTMISPESFSAGHIIPESKGGLIILENCMAICPDCNSQMGSRHLYWFAWHYYGKTMWSVY